jgi:hypothetical protein
MYVTFDGSVQAALDQVAQFAEIGGLVDVSLNFGILHHDYTPKPAYYALRELITSSTALPYPRH